MSVGVQRLAVPVPARPQWGPLGAYPSRPQPVSWPATRADRADVLAVLGTAPFVMDDRVAERKRLVAVGLLLDWLEGSPGQTWQERWQSNEAGVVGLRWRQVLARWLTGEGHRVSWHQDFLAVALRMAISAEVVRPSLPWLLSGSMGR